MSLRAGAATWFELLTARDALAAVLRCLARTGVVELQTHTDVSGAHVLPQLRSVLDEYRQLVQQYAVYWPEPDGTVERQQPPEQLAETALQRLRRWSVAARPLVERLQQLAYERTELTPLQELLSRPALELPDLALFSSCGPVLASRAYLLPPETGALAIPPSVLVERAVGAAGWYVLALGVAEQILAFDDRMSTLKAHRVPLPPQLPARREAALAWTKARDQAIAEESQRLQLELEKLHAAHDVRAARATLAFIEWLATNVPELTVTENFAWVTGWTSDPTGARVEGALRRADLPYLLRFPPAPLGLSPPVVLRNPRWLQPFELFARLLGVPTEGDIDPSAFVALVAPLMFGFMFGDVGQGAVLLAAGVALRRRFPAVGLLIPGGAAAVAFGFAFGSVFGRDDLLEPLWLRPIDHPLTLLKISLVFGACVILVGLLLEAVQYFWSGQGRVWWLARAGFALCYLAVIGAAFGQPWVWALAAGLTWCWIGAAVAAPAGRRWRQIGPAVGGSLETLMQLVVNTISFVRVGAFALAHAGLAAAIVGLAGAVSSRPLALLALAVGNVIVIALEGLVVGIQTTRLILFEFFIRFLKAAGRPFRPLPVPSPSTPMPLPERLSR